MPCLPTFTDTGPDDEWAQGCDGADRDLLPVGRQGGRVPGPSRHLRGFAPGRAGGVAGFRSSSRHPAASPAPGYAQVPLRR